MCIHLVERPHELFGFGDDFGLSDAHGQGKARPLLHRGAYETAMVGKVPVRSNPERSRNASSMEYTSIPGVNWVSVSITRGKGYSRKNRPADVDFFAASIIDTIIQKSSLRNK